MSMAQTLMTFAAFTLLTISVLNMNRYLAQSDIDLAQNRYKLEALSLLNSYIEQANAYYFDEASTDTLTEKKLSDFTAPNNLGFEANDNNIVDDIDDFNNYTVIDTGRSGVVYKLMFDVDYVKVNNSGEIVTSGSRTYFKRMQIAVTDNYNDPLIYHYEGTQKVKDTLRVSFIFGYWFYN